MIGAGPYGLAAAAHLRNAGFPVRVLGDVLEFWRENMPEGMMLRSRKRSSSIADPRRSMTIDHYEQVEGRSVHTPSLMLDEFIDYARWFQRRAVPDVDPRKVSRVERSNGDFRLLLDDGEQLRADAVVVAAGLGPFGCRPEPFGSLPPELASHTSEHCDLRPFAGRRVLVVGGGQSALESAALLHERGAQVEVVFRRPAVHWLSAPSLRRSLRSRLPLPPTDVGGFLSGWTAAMPDVYRRMPARYKPELTFRCIRPAGADWLRPRLERVPLHGGRTVVAAEPRNGRGVQVTLDDGSERIVDHVLLGTGYQIDVTRYPFLPPELAGQVAVRDGYPLLSPGFESSVPGLHFLGAPAALSFGPIMRFVVGTWYAAPALMRRVAGRRQRPISFAF